MKILITGATGFIGQKLGLRLAEKGHEIFVVSRDKKKALLQLPFPCQVIEGDLSQASVKLPKLDSVVHLLGEPVADGRWTAARKKRIRDSRVTSTENLGRSLKDQKIHLVSSSAIGYYGNAGEAQVDEGSGHGEDFLAQVCVEWEGAAQSLTKDCAVVRTGVVLDQQGGALTKMIFPFRAGVGGRLGSGEQWMSWIHLEDLISVYCDLIENKKTGIYNGVSPEPVTNLTFSRNLAEAVGRPLGPPVPAAALKLMFGEMSQILLASQKVLPGHLIEDHFEFQFPTLKSALSKICEPWRQGEDVFVAEQFVPKKVEEVFDFFADAQNLEALTPKTLSFKILGVSTPKVQSGTIIDYKLKIRGVPVKWKTEIEDWQPLKKFVDNQLKGPYHLWHHTHEFIPLQGGTLLRDRVRYRGPLGYLGWLVSGAFVRSEVENIFRYRRAEIFKLFGSSPNS